MKLTKIIITLTSIVLLYSCADYKTQQAREGVEKNYYFSKGFALVYNEDLYYQKVVNKKFSDERYGAMHNLLKVNTSVKIINPSNSKFLDIKISKKANYPKIFSMVDLPDPEGPMIAAYSPSLILRSILRSACTRSSPTSNSRLTLENWIILLLTLFSPAHQLPSHRHQLK